MGQITVEINEQNQLKNLIPAWIETTAAREYVPTGTGIDAITGGLAGLTILGGGPGTGKTALAVQIAENYALQGGAVVYLSYEMGVSGFVTRVFQRLTGISAKDQQRELNRNPESRETLARFAEKVPYLLVEGLPGAGVAINEGNTLTDQLKRLTAATGKTVLLVVDSLHYVPLGAGGAMDGKRAIDLALSRITHIQQETGAAVVAISHQTKTEAAAGESGVMSFSGSAMIAYAADICLIIRKPDTEKGEAYTRIEVTKNRFGHTDGVDTDYNRETQIFSNPSTPEYARF
jgi:replicative DNA helicase